MKPERGLAAVSACMVIALFAGCADLKEDLPAPLAPGVQVHELSWIDRTSPNFHGNAIRAANWDMSSCQTCHGVQFDGGKVGSSCRDCHQGAAGPENCSTCHGSASSVAPPRDLSRNTSRSARGVGAHQLHLMGSAVSGTMFCAECHVTPSAVSTPGHIDATNRAEVLFNTSLARTSTNKAGTTDYDTGNPEVIPAPLYDQATLKCSNTYCHGYFKNGNPTFAPTWNDTTGTQGACGTCHGDVTQPLTSGFRSMPRSTSQGGTHPDIAGAGIACSVCHGEVVDANFRIIDPRKHMNGKLNVFGEERTW